MQKLTVKNISSLEKVLPFSKMKTPLFNKASCLLNEEFSYQIALKINGYNEEEKPLRIEVDSDLAECLQFFNVKYIPIYLNHFKDAFDECYISHNGGLFPDILEPYDGHVLVNADFFKTVWVTVKPTENVTAGIHKIKIKFFLENELWGESTFSLEVIGAKLPECDIPVTNWFHTDCIADYYNVKQLGNKHWQYIDAFLKTYTEHGLNMVLTPVFTPALDTKVGNERPTVQLVDISLEDGKYSFDYAKLEKWLALCKKHGIKYLEIPHLYTQWGAEHAPKIVIKENGKTHKKFGWKTDSESAEYKDFISQFLPSLTAFLKDNWDKDKIFFHISDEPNEQHIDHYGELYKFVKPLLCEFNLIDAVSDVEIFSKGFVDIPVVSTHKVEKFLENGYKNMWAYYCCSQGFKNFSNRFIAMPSFRNRITGIQTYALDIKGFLQWGYNFYYARLSTHKINPYLSADADGGFPAGDPFVVYPADNGAIPSLRFKVFRDGLQDRMAFKLLEQKIGNAEVMKIIEADGKIDFNHYPLTAEYILNLREKINQLIKANI